MSSSKRKGPAPEPQEQPEAVGPATEAAAEAPAEKAAETAPEKNDELAKLRQELAAERDRYLRLLAEYDNFRKRSARERECVYSDVRAETVTKFLPVYDNLARALSHATPDEAYKKGVEMIMAQFEAVLQELCVTAIEALGQSFDPGLHNAVMHVQDESCGEALIVEEFQKGFKMGDKVIRFSMVKVAN